jgi:hypothetical protein
MSLGGGTYDMLVRILPLRRSIWSMPILPGASALGLRMSATMSMVTTRCFLAWNNVDKEIELVRLRERAGDV